MTPREELLQLIEGWNLRFEGRLSDDTPLIASGLFDSQALFNLLVWIEEQIGHPIDPASLDFVAEWNTVRDVVAFIERARRA